MDILVACHSEAEDAKLFVYQPPLFDVPVPLKADYVEPYRSKHRWQDYRAESKDVIWDHECPIMYPFSKIADYLYYDKIFYNLFDDGWKILKPGGLLVIPFPKDFRSVRDIRIDTATALNNFKTVLKRLLSKHSWITYIVQRKSMPFIISEQYKQEAYDDYIIFTKPFILGGERKARKVRSRRTIRHQKRIR